MKTRPARKARAALGANRVPQRVPSERSSRSPSTVLQTGRIEPGRTVAERNGHAELDKVELLKALLAFRRGDFSVRLAPNLMGLDGKIADTFNAVLEINQ